VNYKDEVVKAMAWLGEQPNILFMGQTVKYDGSVISSTLKDVPLSKRLELPVAEEMQCGMAIGMALTMKIIPVAIFPRIDFMLLAINQLSNHLDILEKMTNGEWKAKVIIRTTVAAKSPMYPGIQHCRDHTEVFRALLRNIPVVKLEEASQIMPAYQEAYQSRGSTMIVEMAEKYGN
jgi:pyruvate/2-oxoglutarate/acetoin dehydrogenase E1 component